MDEVGLLTSCMCNENRPPIEITMQNVPPLAMILLPSVTEIAL